MDAPIIVFHKKTKHLDLSQEPYVKIHLENWKMPSLLKQYLLSVLLEQITKSHGQNTGQDFPDMSIAQTQCDTLKTLSEGKIIRYSFISFSLY